jgi:hypothetical protein
MNAISSRRNFLKKFGRTSAGIVAMSTLAAGTEKVKQGSTMAKDEIDKLRESYEKLDKRTQLIMRGMGVLLGIDLVTIL